MKFKKIKEQIYKVPESKNSATSIINYEDRSFIDAVPDVLDNTLDLRLQKQLYGRVDLNNNSIYPNMSFVSFNPSSMTFGFEPVNILLTQFIQDWKNILVKNVPKNSIYRTIAVNNKDFRNTQEALISHYDTTLEQHRDTVINGELETKIRTFEGYIGDLVEFLNVYKIPFSRESLIRTKSFNSQNTGLIFELQKAKHGDDESSYSDYLIDPSYTLIRQTLLRHGFVLDMHSPWRFSLNISSPQILNPSEERGFEGLKERENFINKYYIRAHETEFQHIRTILEKGYNDFISAAKNKGVEYCGKKLKQVVITRSLPTEEELNLQTLNFLIKIRQYETGVTLTESEQTKIFRKSKEDVEAAYKTLHKIILNKDKIMIGKTISRPTALIIANYLRCKGARKDLQFGWSPCADINSYTESLKNLSPSASAVLRNLIAPQNEAPNPLFVDAVDLTKITVEDLDDTEI